MAVLAVVAGLGAAPGLGPAVPAGAALGDPVVSVALPLDRATRLAVEETSGRVFVLGDDGVVVRDAAGGAVGTVAVEGTDVAAGGGAVVVIDGPTGAMTKIDPQTLATTTWALDRSRVDGLVVRGSTAWTTGGATGAGRQLLQVDLATGATAVRISGLDSGPHLLTGTASRLIAIETGSLVTSTVRVIDTRPATATIVTTAEIPQERVADAHLTHDGIGLSVAAGDEVRAYHVPDLEPWGTIPVDGDAPAVFGDGWMVVTGAREGPDTVTVVQPFEPASARVIEGVDTGSPRRGMGFSADHHRLYVIGLGPMGNAPSLQIVDLDPAIDAVGPRVVDPDGGALITVEGQGLAGATARLAYSQLEVVGDGDGEDELVLRTVPICCDLSGVFPLELLTPLGLAPKGEAPSLRVLDLGPFTDSRDLVEAATEEIGDREPGPWELEFYDDALLDGAEAGYPFAWISNEGSWWGFRPTVLRLYRATLGRSPDRAGLEFWADALASGRPLSWVVRSFTGSKEFRDRYGNVTDGGFVDLLYQNVLGRPAEPAGRAYWLGELRRGVPRDRLVVHFSQASEHQVRTHSELLVTMLHLGMLDRVPTAAERARFLPGVSDEDDIAAIATEILRSVEYAVRHP
ncbi:MAG TPA: DUF4214 domain-containing protein [Iamia sp.]|nr:DUF4214 domain-containing protein [Iamia sp.]